MADEGEIAAMRQAIALSSLGQGTTSPNPPVGCIILDTHGTVVGDGYHARKGEPHAEGHALAAAGARARGGTAVVTLEPCNHIGRTPACRQLLLDAGVARVVIAAMDPTSRGDGGAAVLRQAQVSVETGVLESEAKLVLGSWLASTRMRRPHVTWVYRVTPDGQEPVDPAVVDRLRHHFDVLVQPTGELVEGVPRGHGADFSLPGALDRSLPEALAELWKEGTRTLMLNDQGGVGTQLLALSAVDSVVVFITHADAIHQPRNPWLPPGFAIASMTLEDATVRVEARSTPSDESAAKSTTHRLRPCRKRHPATPGFSFASIR
jgi:diaminohydroxyphosphoribosylaminopyrimidine deaminase / 5-amino-6-(5-phosphoribosylamino)uracil reductase